MVGARAMGMGGAGVAVTRGVLSTYWNPAALCPPADPDPVNFFEVALPLAVMGVASGDVLRDLDEAIDLTGQVDFNAIEARLVAGRCRGSSPSLASCRDSRLVAPAFSPM